MISLPFYGPKKKSQPAKVTPPSLLRAEAGRRATYLTKQRGPSLCWHLSFFHTIAGAWTPVCLLASILPVEPVSPPYGEIQSIHPYFTSSAVECEYEVAHQLAAYVLADICDVPCGGCSREIAFAPPGHCNAVGRAPARMDAIRPASNFDVVSIRSRMGVCRGVYFPFLFVQVYPGRRSEQRES